MEIARILSRIGEDGQLRARFIEWCKLVEKEFPYNGSVRDDFTKYLVDAIYSNVPIERKRILNGLTFEFIPNVHSKVAREFIMSEPTTPDHVWEPQTTKLLLYLSESAKNVIIGGAYFGDQAILVADKIKANGGKVHAFDLNKTQMALLRRNAVTNLLDNIVPIDKGLWSDAATFLNLSDDDDLAFATAGDSSALQLSNTTTVDNYLIENGIDAIDLIMLDIEGSEMAVLKGAEQQLRKEEDKSPNIVFEVHSKYVDWSNGLHNSEIVKYLTSFGYIVYSVRDFQANYDLKNKAIELVLPEDTYLVGPQHGFNMLAIKNANLIRNGMFRVCRNVSPKYLVHKDPKLHHPIDGFK